MEKMRPWVTFMDLPFGRERGEKGSNDRNLDLIHEYIEASGCEVFVADIWNRALPDDMPSEQDQAAYRAQAIAIDTNTHCMLVHQQRLGDVEKRSDPRQTREGMKGAKGIVEVADTIFGSHYPGLFNLVEPVKFEVDILKQRFAKWPLRVEFEFSPDRGMIWGGKGVPYESPELSIDDPLGIRATRR